MEQDPFILELINDTGLEVDINSVDEEGVGLLHRISASHIRHTRRSVQFSFLPFKGAPGRQKINLKRIIATIRQLGGITDLLTTPNIEQAQPGENLSSVQSMTPLMMAVHAVGPALNTIVVEALLEEKINPNTPNHNGATALHLARPSRNRRVYDKLVRLLCASGADVNYKQKDGTRPLLSAARRGSIAAMSTLLSQGADFTEREWETNSINEGAGVFYYGIINYERSEVDAVDAQIAECFEKYVFSHPLDDNQRILITKGDLDDCTLLHRCAETTMVHSMRALLREGADVNALRWSYERTREEDRTELEVHMSQITPLDVAEKSKKLTIRNQSMDSMKLSHTEFESRLKRHDLTIEILKGAGGSSGPGQIITKRVPWTREDGARRWSRYREIRDLCLLEDNI